MTAPMMPSRLVRRVRFDDFDPRDFERLVLAFMHRTGTWRSSPEWYGEVGADRGRDVWGVRQDGRTVCVQCANWRTLPVGKVKSDLRKILGAKHGVPDVFVVVAGGRVSASTRDAVRVFARAKGIGECHVWSGADFEELVRAKAESLLRRFCEGEAFPDDPAEVEGFLRGCPLCRLASRALREERQRLEHGGAQTCAPGSCARSSTGSGRTSSAAACQAAADSSPWSCEQGGSRPPGPWTSASLLRSSSHAAVVKSTEWRSPERSSRRSAAHAQGRSKRPRDGSASSMRFTVRHSRSPWLVEATRTLTRGALSSPLRGSN